MIDGPRGRRSPSSRWSGDGCSHRRTVSNFNQGQYLIWTGRKRAVHDGQSQRLNAVVSSSSRAARHRPGTQCPPRVTVHRMAPIAPANLTFTATAAASDGSIKEVRFYMARPCSARHYGSYAYTWSKVAAGAYSVTATPR